MILYSDWGGGASYKCPDWVFWATLSSESLYPVGAILDQKWFSIWSLAKVGVVNSSADFTLIFYNQEVRDGLVGQDLLGTRLNLSTPLISQILLWRRIGLEDLQLW